MFHGANSWALIKSLKFYIRDVRLLDCNAVIMMCQGASAGLKLTTEINTSVSFITHYLSGPSPKFNPGFCIKHL